MNDLRVLHQLHAPDGHWDHSAITTYAAGLRSTPGLLEAEAYVAIDDRSRSALVERWESQAAYARHWRQRLAGGGDGTLLAEIGNQLPEHGTEFYEYQPFFPDRGWVSSTFQDEPPVVIWPARGAVRIIAQLAVPVPDAAMAGFELDQAQTRREPGCVQYGWFQGTEFTQDMLLLELWESQPVYDHHWNLRIKTGKADEPPPETPRGTGTTGIEFYRHQAFTHLYDRWLPSDQSTWSEMVIWPG